jgi:chromosome segregation ATPase
MSKEIPDEVIMRCEVQIDRIKQAQKYMIDNPDQMSSGPLRMIDQATKALDDERLDQYQLPERLTHPELYDYMVHQRQAAARKAQDELERQEKLEREERERREAREKREADEEAAKREWQRRMNSPEGRIERSTKQLEELEKDIEKTRARLEQLEKIAESVRGQIARAQAELSGSPIDSMFNNLDLEINRSRNKLKYMEAQLFPTGTPSGKSSGH